MGRQDQAEQHFRHYYQHQHCQKYLQLVLFEPGAQTRTDLGAESGADQKQEGQNEIDGSV